jgi:hypothetical protein
MSFHNVSSSVPSTALGIQQFKTLHNHQENPLAKELNLWKTFIMNKNKYGMLGIN